MTVPIDRANTVVRPLILVVDDDPQIRQALTWAFEDEGLLVETAADSREALARAARHQPALVVLDMTLPDGDGADVAAALRALMVPNPPILAISADGRVAAKARRAGAVDYLAKPFEIDALLAAVRRALDA